MPAAPDKLLEPISTDTPCGADVDADGSLLELEHALKENFDPEKPESSEPDWEKVRELCSALLKRSKDLRVAVIYCLVLLRKEGLDGFSKGLSLLDGFVTSFWDGVHPLLDPKDPEDETRVHVLNNLSAPLGTDTPYRFLSYLRQIPLTRSKLTANYSLRDILAAESKGKNGADGPASPTHDQLKSAFNNTLQADWQKMLDTVKGAIKTLKQIQTVVSDKSAGRLSPDFKELIGDGEHHGVLEEMENRLAEYRVGVEPVLPVDPVNRLQERGLPTGAGFSGSVNSRADAEQALKAVAAYFKRAEPSSPIPFMVDRTLRVLKMDFMQSLSELHPAAVDDFKKLFGLKDETNPQNTSS